MDKPSIYTMQEKFENLRIEVLGVIDKRKHDDGVYFDNETQKDWMLFQAIQAKAQAEKAQSIRQCAELCEKMKVEAGRDFELQAWNSALNTAIKEILSLLPKE